MWYNRIEIQPPQGGLPAMKTVILLILLCTLLAGLTAGVPDDGGSSDVPPPSA